MTPRLSAIHVSIGYRLSGGKHHAIAEHLNIDLRPGELTCLLGPNGIGKSTLLRTLAGIQPALSGVVHLDDMPIESYTSVQRAQCISMVLSQRGELGHIPARSLVGLGRHPYTGILGGLGRDDHDKVEWALKSVAAHQLADHYVDELSDGERQKIMIARALAQDPDILLLDEPTSHLDVPHRFEILQHLRRFAWASNRSVLMTTHDMDQALRMADRILLFMPDGTLVDGAPEDLVLSGEIHKVFPHEHIRFDSDAGRFLPVNKSLMSVSLKGDGECFRWTETALARSGISTATNDHAITVVCEQSGDVKSWKVCIQESENEVSSVYELLNVIRASEDFKQAIKGESNGSTK